VCRICLRRVFPIIIATKDASGSMPDLRWRIEPHRLRVQQRAAERGGTFHCALGNHAAVLPKGASSRCIGMVCGSYRGDCNGGAPTATNSLERIV